MVSGLPLVTKPLRTRLRLIADAMALLAPGAPFVQFTYAMVPPIPKSCRASRRSLRADLDEPAAGARVGLSRPLIRVVTAVGIGRAISCGMPLMPDAPKILVLPGSTRTGSHNVRLAALAAKELTLLDVDVTRISLADYPLPLYDADLDARAGQPANALKLKQMIMAHQGIFIASPEYSASVTPLLKNAIDWVSRVRERGDPTYAAFKGRVFAIASASPGAPAACAR